MQKFTLLLFTLFILTACGKFEYSPNQAFDENTPRNINEININRILSTPGDDTIRFVLSGDSQRSYDSDVKFVELVNQTPNVDFVVLDGDISDFGLLQEYKWIDEIYKKLKVPYVGVIGNHDYQGNGEKIYENIYGAKNFSFIYHGLKFVCHDTNSLENYNDGTTPDINWLQTQFDDPNVSGFVPIGHVPPFSAEFDRKLEEPYKNILNGPKLICALYAHVGKTDTYHPYEEAAPYITTGGLDNRQYMIIEIVNGKLNTKVVKY
ncbi:MAG: metallophosphoesterase [Sphingobacteriaceae bacterium]|jgi:hypothetical protein|nr:metallophosphoesterase [Sphingobacteriaceae bacterium]